MERVDLPFFRVDLSPPFLIFTHGLGSSYPKVKSHKNDAWVNVAAEASKLNNNSFLTYTARGHGDSKGWQVTASLNLFQFTWKSLASDMATVADSEGIDKFVAGGSSMGSATALFCAIQHPERVLGLVLVRLPTAWETRRARRHYLANSAERCRTEHPDELYHYVLEGTMDSDLPPLESSNESYGRITCPVLILAVSGDEVHPVNTSVAVHKVIQQSQLVVAESETQAAKEWPMLIADFMSTIRKNENNSTCHSAYTALP